MENKSSFKMDVKPHAGFGILSFAIAVAALICFVAAVIGTAFYMQEGVLWPGFLGAAAIVLNLVGLVFGVIGEFQPDTEKLFPHLALGFHLVLLVLNITVLVQGY